MAVYTRAPKPAGRGMKLQRRPVAQEAGRLGIPVLTPPTLKKPEALGEFRTHRRGCGRGCRLRADPAAKKFLMRRQFGCFNLHASLLPLWRGAAPINRAIIAGDAESGVMVMKMDVGLDTGDVAMAERVTITDDHDRRRPARRAGAVGADLMVRAMGALERGSLQLTKQSEDGVTYAAKIDKYEARIDWKRPAREVLRHIHGLSPFPGGWCEIATDGEPARIKILRCEPAKDSGAPGEVLDDRLTIACGEGAIRILELQRAGKAPMKSADFLRGTPLKAGARFA